MSTGHWSGCLQRIGAQLSALSVRDRRGRELGADRGLELWRRLAVRVRTSRRTLFLAGNGASASLASHLAADLAKNACVHTEVFTDLALLTALANDLGYDQVFALPLLRRARRGDLLVAISSSGASPNILEAVKAARSRRLTVVTLSAKKPDNPLRSGGDLNFYLPAETYGDAESGHALLLHAWMDLLEIKAPAPPRRARPPR